MKKHFRSVIVLFCIFIILLACKKFRELKSQNDIKGDSYIRGRLFLYDSLTKSRVLEAAGGKKITIRYADSQDTLNYISEQVADKDGYFTFKDLQAGSPYQVTYEEHIGGILYRATDTLTPAEDAASLIAYIAEDRQRGFHAVVMDSSKGTYRNIDICVFDGPQTFATKNCSLSTLSLKTDSFGRVHAFGIPSKKYYFHGETTLGNQLYFISGSIDVTSFIKKDTFYLQKKEQNGIQYTVLDATGHKVPGGNICVFTSLALYNRDTCEGSNFSLPVNENAIALKTNIDPDTYYVFLKRTFGDGAVTLFARDTITVGNKVVIDTLRLQ